MIRDQHESRIQTWQDLKRRDGDASTDEQKGVEGPRARYEVKKGETEGLTRVLPRLLLGSQDIQDGKLVGGDGRLLADDTEPMSDYTEDSSDDGKPKSDSGSDDDDDSEEDETRDSDDASLMPREWPRSKSQRLVDAAEDTPGGATTLRLVNLGLPRLTFRALSIETLTESDVGVVFVGLFLKRSHTCPPRGVASESRASTSGRRGSLFREDVDRERGGRRAPSGGARETTPVSLAVGPLGWT